MEDRYAAQDLMRFATALFRAAGLDADKAQVTGGLLVEADLLGHTTHGLQLADSYLGAIARGDMATTGEPEVIADYAAALTWDGRYLPGPWLTRNAVIEAATRAETCGVAAVVIRRSSHIGCLAAYLEEATLSGQMVIISSSDPDVATVAPYGGRQPVFTPDPIAIGIPTDRDPIMIDISASITTNGMCARLDKEGRTLPGEWVLDADGRPSSDPSQVTRHPPGTILPVGGMDHGHKGYGLALMIEAMTQGLAGFGRADNGHVWGASVCVQVFAPDLFGGANAFIRQTGWLREACATNPPRPDVEHVRLPGHAGIARKRQALEAGVVLHPGIMQALKVRAQQLKVDTPAPLTN
ncbi:MAG: Ldh family oxidoreductase [Pseudomonadota bacterium]